MSSEERFLNEKILRELDKQVEEISDRVGVDRKTLDEVFDKSTLHTLGKLISDRVIDIVDFPISTGKEGNVFRAVKPDKKLVAVKIYRVSTSTFKHVSKYIIGDPRFSSLRRTKRDIIYAWTKKEYKNLERLQNIGINAPKPVAYLNNVLVMQYIGYKNKPAPLLKDVSLDHPKEMFDTLLGFISKMYKEAELVHADFSVFNILLFRNKPYIIDLGQGVLLEHPLSDEFLRRDISNIIRYFKKYNIYGDKKRIYNRITNKQW